VTTNHIKTTEQPTVKKNAVGRCHGRWNWPK